MINKIYKLTQLPSFWLPTRTVILVAKSEQEARDIANQEGYNKLYKTDWSEKNADIEIISTKKPGIILADTSD